MWKQEPFEFSADDVDAFATELGVCDPARVEAFRFDLCWIASRYHRWRKQDEATLTWSQQNAALKAMSCRPGTWLSLDSETLFRLHMAASVYVATQSRRPPGDFGEHLEWVFSKPHRVRAVKAIALRSGGKPGPKSPRSLYLLACLLAEFFETWTGEAFTYTAHIDGEYAEPRSRGAMFVQRMLTAIDPDLKPTPRITAVRYAGTERRLKRRQAVEIAR